MKKSLFLIIVLSVVVAIAVLASACKKESKGSPVAQDSTITFTVEQANALIASSVAVGSLDLYADNIYGDCYVFFVYKGYLYAPEVEHLFNSNTGQYVTETMCYNRLAKF